MYSKNCEFDGRKYDFGDVVDAAGFSTSTIRSRSPHIIAPVHRYATEYNLMHKNRGIALIFNNENFIDKNLLKRTGTNADCDNLKKTLENLEFKVEVCNDYTWKRIEYKIYEVSKMDHSNNDCILITILSHGNDYGIYAKDELYTVEQISLYFTPEYCPTLALKPKMFFIQACRGEKFDEGSRLKSVETDGQGTAEFFKIPNQADFLFAYSTAPGYFSWRGMDNGSWFIRALCHELNMNGTRYNILVLLTFVCQTVAMDFESYQEDNPAMCGKKQVPCTVSFLTKLLKFNKKTSLK